MGLRTPKNALNGAGGPNMGLRTPKMKGDPQTHPIWVWGSPHGAAEPQKVP